MESALSASGRRENHMAELIIKTDFDPSAACASYDSMKPSWELNRDFAEMLLSILRDGTYLDEFGGGNSAEASAQYTWRKNASLAIDHCADLIGLRVDNIFRTPPVRLYKDSPFADFIEEFLANVDGGGTSIDDFMRRALVQYYTNGVDFVVDKESTPADADVTNLAQERALGLLPYVHAFGPLERLDWAVDHAGGYLWARFDLGAEPRGDERDGGSQNYRYLTLTRGEWRLYTQTGDSGTFVESGPTMIDECPIVPFYFKQSSRPDKPKTPLSLLTRIAPISRYVLNLVSQVQIDILRNIGFMATTGVDSDQVPTEISPMSCWALPDGATIAMLAGDVAHIDSKIRFAQMLMETVLRIGKLTGATGDLKSRAASGVQVAVERTDLDNEMRMTAEQAGYVEREIVRLAVARHVGGPVTVAELGYSVQYNTRYVLSGVTELVEHLREFVGIGVTDETPEMIRVMLRKLLNAITKEDDPAYEDAMQEIEDADFSDLPKAGERETPDDVLNAGEDLRE
jgi:hypothetical protein